jgi:hypothetical protein
VPRYGRWRRSFDRRLGVDRVEFALPEGAPEEASAQVRPTFLHQPAELKYDEHGYEAVAPRGEPVTAVRFTPAHEGVYRYRAFRGQESVEEGSFRCDPSDHPGYVEVSKRDPRYFAFSDGSSYCAIGLNLCGPCFYRLPRGSEHFRVSGQSATLGCGDYGRWFRELSAGGGNFARLWLSNRYFEAQTEVAGELDLAAFARVEAVIELARRYGIRLKLCLENFRALDPKLADQYTVLKHPEDGRSPRDMDEWFLQETWQELWWKRVRAYLARYGDDPIVMAWELWNEINCCVTSDWSVQREWTRRTLPRIKALSRRNLVVNSIGSFDYEPYQSWYDDFKMEEMDFQQVHRYLDQGARMEICRHDPPAFSVDAIERARRPDRPVLLAETGAVNDAHTGPFRYCRMDHRGIIFHDTTFPAFFAGAAGTGHIWHWDSYVDQKDLFGAFRPFTDLIAGVQLDAEDFRAFDLSTEKTWALGLRGKQHLLLWVRNRADSWYRTLRDRQAPHRLRGQQLDLRSLGIGAGEVSVFHSWHERVGPARLTAGVLHLPDFRFGLMVKVRG